MERRPLGKTGEQLSVIGFGGIIVRDQTTAEAAASVSEAIDAGVNYFDVAPSYGNAQPMLGPALEPHRDQVFLACKTAKRSKDEAALELRQSLAQLKTDHLDLYQLHALTTDQDIEQAFGPGGAMEELVEAKQLGLVRYLGFSAHSEAAALKAMSLHDFDSILFPFNYWAWHVGGFGPKVMNEAIKRGVGRLALKSMAYGRLQQGEKKDWNKAWYQPLDTADTALPSIRWTLSQPITAAVTPGHLELFRIAVKVADGLRPPTWDEVEHLAQMSEQRPPIFPDPRQA